jgi:hypothetical protein
MNDYYTAKECAEKLGMNYHAFMQHIYRGELQSKKFGWGVFIHKDEFKRFKGDRKSKC